MTATVIDMKAWKYSKIATTFVNLRSTDPSAAAQYAKTAVRPDEFSILSKYIDAELSRQRGQEPYEGK